MMTVASDGKQVATGMCQAAGMAVAMLASKIMSLTLAKLMRRNAVVAA